MDRRIFVTSCFSVLLFVFASCATKCDCNEMCNCSSSCGCKDGKECTQKTCKCHEDDNKPSESEKVSKIGSMFIYIDSSASIKGYFSLGSDGRFGNTIAALSSYGNLNNPVYFWGNKTQVNTTLNKNGGINNALLNSSNFGQDSYFNVILDSLCNWTNKGSMDVACLVTDGMYGVENALTRRNPNHAYTTLPQFKDAVKNVFSTKNGKLGISVYMLEAGYSAKGKDVKGNNIAYIDYQNTKIYNLEIPNRPFYIIMVGKPEKLRSIRDNNILGAELALHCGLHDKMYHNKCRLTDVKHFKNGEWKGTRSDSEANLATALPKCLGDDDFVKKHTKVTIYGYELETSAYSVKNHTLKVNLEVMSNVKVKKGKNVVNVTISNSIPSQWESLYSVDDKKIVTDTIQQKQTFGLRYLLEGIFEGVNETELMNIDFEFTK